jgi:ABC-type Fe3+ transport system permease subunit
MMVDRIGWELALLAVLCVVVVFFFPAVQGPYSAVNGPVSALRSAQAAARLRRAIVQSVLNTFGNYRISVLLGVNCAAELLEELPRSSLAECDIVLRC